MKINRLFYLCLLFGLGLFVSCSDDENPTPIEGEDEEEISKIVLTFTPDNGEDAVTATWLDADGEGGNDPTIEEIELEEDVTYTLTMTLTNTLGSADEDITAEISKEADEHMFFFSFSEGYFTDPAGDGNADNREDAIKYVDKDSNDLPVGLETTWTTGDHSEEEGEFTVILKHQPDLKTATSDATIGGTDVNITFPLHIEEEGHEHNDDEEEINKVVMTFTPTSGDAVVVTWFDADGEGVGNPVKDPINLVANTEYEMSITLTNTLGTEDEDITAEIAMEDDEHMFFFGFTADIFSNPTGNGNIDARADALNYNDQDESGNPVGLSTNWTSGAATTSAGDFRIMLKHQPDLKTATSDATVGGTDLDLSFVININ